MDINHFTAYKENQTYTKQYKQRKLRSPIPTTILEIFLIVPMHTISVAD